MKIKGESAWFETGSDFGNFGDIENVERHGKHEGSRYNHWQSGN